jgi:hypothetical protein
MLAAISNCQYPSSSQCFLPRQPSLSRILASPLSLHCSDVYTSDPCLEGRNKHLHISCQSKFPKISLGHVGGLNWRTPPHPPLFMPLPKGWRLPRAWPLYVSLTC